MPTIFYEWVSELVDLESEDIEDLDHRETYAEVMKHIAQFPAPEGYRYDVAITRRRYARDDPDQLEALSYAYLEDGALEEEFTGEETAKVPARFHAEVAKYRK